jgi:hypothetical protein
MARHSSRDSQPAGSPRKPRPAGRPARRLRPPSDRDLEVYKRTQIEGQRQWQVAQDRGLDPSRVSQIVKQVERWLAAGGCPTDPAVREHADRQRLSRARHKLRLTRAIERAAWAMEAPPYPVTTTRRRWVGDTEVWREETTRESPSVNLPAVRLLLRATDALHKLESQSELDEPEQPTSEPYSLPAVVDYLCRQRERAELAGWASPSSDRESIRFTVADTLDALLGTNLTGTRPLPLPFPPPPPPQPDRSERDQDHAEHEPHPLPLPLGEGRGEGVWDHAESEDPHPNPLPQGAGTADTPHLAEVPIAAAEIPAHEPLNMSAAPRQPDSPTPDAATTSAEANPPAGEQNPKHERSAAVAQPTVPSPLPSERTSLPPSSWVPRSFPTPSLNSAR